MVIMNCATMLLLIVLFVVPAYAFEAAHDLYGQVQSFTWKEFDGGERLLKESGPLYAIGYRGDYQFVNMLTLSPRAEVFGGEVDYDGQACNPLSGVCFPVDTDTNYLGYKTEVDIGLRFMVHESVFFEPFGGLGYRWWRRDIENTSDALGTTEIWRIFYWRLGLRGDYEVKDVRTFVEATIKLPIVNRERVEDIGCFLGSCRDVDLEPGKRNAYYTEVGMRYGSFKAVLFYEGLRFSESAVEGIGGGFGVLQPASEADIYGINMGWSF